MMQIVAHDVGYPYASLGPRVLSTDHVGQMWAAPITGDEKIARIGGFPS